MKKYLIPAIAIIFIIAIAYLSFTIGKHFGNSESDGSTLIIHDTLVVDRYKELVKKDTVIKWYEKIIWKESEPKVIYVQKVDSVFIEKVKGYDVMLRVEKAGDKLKIIAFNQSGKILKEYIYDNIGNSFIAVSQDSNIFIKSKKVEFNGIWIEASVSNSIPELVKKNINLDYDIGVGTGINISQKVDISTGIYYRKYILEKGFHLRLGAKIKLF